MQPTPLTYLRTERAISELKRGLGVWLNVQDSYYLCFAAETVTPDTLRRVAKKTSAPLQLVLTPERIHYLTQKKITSPGQITLDVSKLDHIESLVFAFPAAELEENITEADDWVQDGLALLQYAELLPSLIMCEAEKEVFSEFLAIDREDIKAYQLEDEFTLERLTEAALPLTHAKKSKIVAFRHPASSKEHYAIIIGEPGKEPLVRVHSSCYTGDLLASLACDCRDQLHSAIKKMGAEGGGIILYLLQEGRGIGLINKLRAYAIKAQGKDTVEANEILGFADDARLFLPAAYMLKDLGVKQVQLLSNNPRKAKGLEQHGITVTKLVPHKMETNPHNEAYLQSKAEKLGHQLDCKKE